MCNIFSAGGGGDLALVLFVCFNFVRLIYFLICCEFLRLNIHINQYLRTCTLYDEINVSMPNIKNCVLQLM